MSANLIIAFGLLVVLFILDWVSPTIGPWVETVDALSLACGGAAIEIAIFAGVVTL